jgi:iron complex outermembrane receptor protein
MSSRLAGATAFACGLAAASTALANTAAEPGDLSRLSIEELANVEITSVSKRPERLADAAASVFVISNDDVRRSGAQSLAEALRLAPNLNVQRVDSTDYAISARGLNGFESSNKLLVLIDGRSVYSPFFSGVEWSQLHPPLPDLDRIEVISGPGGALWGANAVNGVINVTTRSAADTQGLLLEATGGTGDSSLFARYGGGLGATGAFRVYAEGRRFDDTLLAGADAGDGWEGAQAGFRTDFALTRDHVTVQGDAYYDDVPSADPARPQGKYEGSNLLARWTRTFDDESSLEVQAYYDRYERRARGILDGVITYDVEAQYAFQRGRHRIVAGGGYRRWNDKFANYVNGFVLDPPRREIDQGSLFIQDQIGFGDVTLTLGLKGEDNSYSGLEWMPSARLAWKASETGMVWAAVSRAVRNPSRLDRELVFPPFLLRSDFEPERLVAYELGYRGRPAERLSLSATLFYHDYEGLRSTEPTPGGPFPLHIGNGLEGETWGLEAWGDFDVTEGWRLSAGLSTLGKDFRRSSGSGDVSSMASIGHDPAFQGFIRSQARLSQTLDLDLRLRYVSEVPREQVGGYLDAPAYAEADARLGWRVNDHVELSIAGVNLLDAAHLEATEPRRTEARRSVQARLRLNW